MTTFRLRELRERAGLSHAQLAKKMIGWHPNTIRFYEHPQRGHLVSWEMALACSLALGCTLDELAGIEAREEMQP